MGNTLIEIATVLLGFLIRFGIPISLTILLSMFLKWLDRRWQATAAAETKAKLAIAPDARWQSCWEIHNCPPRLRNACQAYAEPDTPCWELFRVNGRLKPACQTCKVLPPASA